MTASSDPESARLDRLPAALALEVDALCDDFERHWRRARRRGRLPPNIESFIARASAAARPALRHCLIELQRELRTGVVLPEIPGLTIEEEIGRGGMGVVYRARRVEDGRPVALKLIPGAEHARWSRWLAELLDLRHPNLVPFEAFGTHDGLYYVVMPLVAGGDLKERFGEFAVGPDAGRAALRGVAALTAKVADAVDFLHRCGILHRDLKPSNILLASPHPPNLVPLPHAWEQAGLRRRPQWGEGIVPLVCDFGLAGRLDESAPLAPHVAGTPPYMSPEQMKGAPVTAAADIWSLGAVLYELLTGQPPFVDAQGRLDADRKQLTEPTPPCDRNAVVDAALQRICLRCLGRDPRARYATAAGLAEDLRHYLNEPQDLREDP